MVVVEPRRGYGYACLAGVLAAEASLRAKRMVRSVVA